MSPERPVCRVLDIYTNWKLNHLGIEPMTDVFKSTPFADRVNQSRRFKVTIGTYNCVFFKSDAFRWKLFIIHRQISVKSLRELLELSSFKFLTSFFWRFRIKWFRFLTSCVSKEFEYYDLVRRLYIFCKKGQYKEARVHHLHIGKRNYAENTVTLYQKKKIENIEMNGQQIIF